jgi:hypothetical protein
MKEEGTALWTQSITERPTAATSLLLLLAAGTIMAISTISLNRTITLVGKPMPILN